MPRICWGRPELWTSIAAKATPSPLSPKQTMTLSEHGLTQNHAKSVLRTRLEPGSQPLSAWARLVPLSGQGLVLLIGAVHHCNQQIDQEPLDQRFWFWILTKENGRIYHEDHWQYYWRYMTMNKTHVEWLDTQCLESRGPANTGTSTCNMCSCHFIVICSFLCR